MIKRRTNRGSGTVIIREAIFKDIESIRTIYNEGIEDRIATLEIDEKDPSYMKEWFIKHEGRYKIIVAEVGGEVVGWAALNPYNNRCAYSGVADLSVYISRNHRGKGIGTKLLKAIDNAAKTSGFHKIVLFTFPFNEMGQKLYVKNGYREVGTFKNQGVLDGKFVDVMAMEKLL
ncbi:arsinothricin resistance N-acetyltransferase ArsN1 family A [Robertmurraya massiliosenegalensis]|uniref:arsinothricin resistance N-acetyltransferase ArsN1 family A n=1 Tax=Robertmurraya massiliosenegalensis TaxID=1287657 RepID=UPI000685D50A|nr:arsinothricin resistance N-acetyltransferase ArsN1 family A [Robertmurraya massiliosenegalensis]